MTDFMTDNRVRLRDSGSPIIPTPRFCAIYNAVDTFSPTLKTRSRISIITMPVIFRNSRPAGCCYTEETSVFRFPMIHKIRQVFLMSFSSRFIPIREETERRMIGIFLHDTFAFIHDKPVDRFATAYLCPGTTFHIQIKTKPVCHIKSSFRRTPGVETQMVQPMCPASFHDTLPFGFICRRKSGFRKNTTLQCSTEKYRTPIYGNLGSFRRQFTHSELFNFFIFARFRIQLDLKRIQVRSKLIPQTWVISHFIRNLNRILSFLQFTVLRNCRKGLGNVRPKICLQVYYSFKRFFIRIFNLYFCQDFLFLYSRHDTYGRNICLGSSFQHNSSNHSIPVALGIIGYTMCIRSGINLFHPVINPKSKGMFTGR